MRKLTEYFGDGSFWRSTARLALPIAIQNLLISSFSMVDTAMVSQLGDNVEVITATEMIDALAENIPHKYAIPE